MNHVTSIGSCGGVVGRLVRVGLGLLACVAFGVAHSADFLYTVQPGDHPWNLAQRFLKNPRLGPRLLSVNQIHDDRRIMPGITLRIPHDWLKLQTTQVRVLAVFGDITQRTKGGNEHLVQVGELLKSPLTLRTGGTGSATLQFADGTRVLMRRDSELELRQTQQRVLGHASLVQLFLLYGSLENQVTPVLDSGGRFEIRTPAAVAAVRGTQFRVQARGAELRTEVLEGVVNVDTGVGQLNANAGQGLVSQSGRPPDGLPTALLEAPSLDGLPERIERLPIDLPLATVAGAAAYRTQLAPDADFSVLTSDESSASARIRARDVDDGRYVVRVRAVDARGLEGFSAQRTLVVHARPAAPLMIEPVPLAATDNSRPVFRWALGAAGWRYRLQISAMSTQVLVDDQMVQAQDSTRPLQELPPATYQWRVAAIHPQTGQGPWSDLQIFRRVLPGPGVAQVQVNDGTTTLRWPGQEQVAHYHLQVARESGFATPLVDVQPEVAQHPLQGLTPGTYHVRVQTIGSDGYTGPWGGTQTFVVPEPGFAGWRALLLLVPLIAFL